VIIRFVENIGSKTVDLFSSLFHALYFSLICFFSLFSFKHYNAQTLQTFIKQIYSISIVSLPKFLFLATIFGSLLIGLVIVLAAKFNMQMQIGSIIITFVFNEFAPLFTMFFVYVKLILFIKSKLKSLDIELLIPQLLSGIISTLILSFLFSVIMLSSGLIVTSFVIGMDFHSYKNILLDAIEIHNVVILILKSFLFGFISVVVLSYEAIIGIKIPLMVLIINIFFIEMLSLVFQSLLL
jgi:phospholipid/cholesterol/gamma-HCH transport system permease protein